jgi:hypothetical protein
MCLLGSWPVRCGVCGAGPSPGPAALHPQAIMLPEYAQRITAVTLQPMCLLTDSSPPGVPHAAAVGAVATLWATKLVAGAASSALDQQVEGEEEQQGLLGGSREEE